MLQVLKRQYAGCSHTSVPHSFLHFNFRFVSFLPLPLITQMRLPNSNLFLQLHNQHETTILPRPTPSPFSCYPAPFQYQKKPYSKFYKRDSELFRLQSKKSTMSLRHRQEFNAELKPKYSGIGRRLEGDRRRSGIVPQSPLRFFLLFMRWWRSKISPKGIPWSGYPKVSNISLN
jgi:hypothetical protein